MLRVYYYYFKILFPFPSRPSCCHDPPGGLCTEGETLRSRAVFHLAFSHGLNQAFQGTTESFQNCSGAGPSFVRGGWRYGGHQQNTVIVIPNRERVRDVWEAQCLASKLGGGTLFIQVHVFSQTGDGRKVLLRICSWSNSNSSHPFSVSPQSQQSVHQAMLQVFSFFSFNFRGRRRSKKSAVLQLKCMNEVN